MEEEYRAAVKKFYETYRPMARRYNLRMQSHFSMRHDGWIKIYKREGTSEKMIVKCEEENDVECYRRATEALTSWECKKRERQKAAG